MAVDEIPKIAKKGEPLPHFTEQMLREEYNKLPTEIELGDNGTLKHKPQKVKAIRNNDMI